MDDNTNSLTMHNIIQKLIQKLEIIKSTTRILQCENNIKDELEDTNKCVTNIQMEIINTESLITKTEDIILNMQSIAPNLQELEELYCTLVNSSQLQSVTERVHASNTIQFNDNKFELKEINAALKDINNQENIHSNKNDANIEKKIIRINMLNQDEFNKIPKYIIGRNNITVVNNFIDTLNEVLNDKYSFLALGRAKAKKKNQLERFLKYKVQETTIKSNKGSDIYFFTEEDYKNYTKIKLDKIKLNFLTALRHAKRIEFNKINKDVYYAIVNNRIS